MRIVHVETGRRLYGGARQVCYLLDGLARLGARNVLVCAEGSAIAAEARGAQVVELPIRGDLDVGLTRRVRRQLAHLRPDLVHVHSRRGADLYAGIAAAAAGVPAVLTRRVDHPEWRPWARSKYSRYAALIAISRAVQALLVEQAGMPRERVHFVPSGVDTDAWRPDPAARARLVADFALRDDAVLIGVVAQLIPRKGHATLLDALPAVLRRHEPVQVLCFGQGPLEPQLARTIAGSADPSLSAHVKLLGYHPDLRRWLPGLDVLAHPANREGLGVAVLEAMASGVPVLVSRAGGLTDVVRHDESGLLVAPGDPAAWTAALQRLIADPRLRRELGAAGRRRVERDFSVEAMVNGNRAVYDSILAG